MNAIENGRKDIRNEKDFDSLRNRNDIAKVHNIKPQYDKNDLKNVSEKFADKLTSNGTNSKGMSFLSEETLENRGIH